MAQVKFYRLATHSQRVKIIQIRWPKLNSLSSCAGCSATQIQIQILQTRWLKLNSLSSFADCSATQIQIQIQIRIQIIQTRWLKLNSLSSCADCSATQATMSSWQKARSSPTSSRASGARYVCKENRWFKTIFAGEQLGERRAGVPRHPEHPLWHGWSSSGYPCKYPFFSRYPFFWGKRWKKLKLWSQLLVEKIFKRRTNISHMSLIYPISAVWQSKT